MSLRIPPGLRQTIWLFTRGFDSELSREQIKLVVRAGLELGASGLHIPLPKPPVSAPTSPCC